MTEPVDNPAPPAIYVDAVQGHAQWYSCQLVFGTHGLDGEVQSKVHLTVSPTFALQLARVLAEIVQPYTASGSLVVAGNGHTERDAQE